MNRRASRLLLGLALVALSAAAVLHGVDVAHAQAGPFGVAAPEAGGPVAHDGVFGWIAHKQSEFYKALTGGLRKMRADPNAGWWLIALSFAYGVFHAAGPGHGKAVITSYVLANNQTWKRGVFLSFVSAIFQGLAAIVFVAAAMAVFRLTALQMTDATMVLERTSALAILSLGLWLAWTKVIVPARTALAERAALPALATEDDVVDCAIATPQRPSIAAALCACGQSHGPDPSTLEGTFDLRRAASAILAVGVRPCTGALIVLVFAFTQGLLAAGVASVLAMAIGTGATVAALASFAVGARSLALRVAGEEGPWPIRILRAGEIGGAALVLTMGVLLTGAAFLGGGGVG